MTKNVLLSPVSISVYDNDVVVKYEREYYEPPKEYIKRNCIGEFTYKSRRRLAFIANNTPVRFVYMVTLTYPETYETDGKKVKYHFKVFKQWLSRKLKPLEVLWFLEFQRRGAPHYHMLIDRIVPKDMFAGISQKWAKVVNSGDEKHVKAGTRVERLRTSDGGARYATKYAMKPYQKLVPENYQSVGRFWGHTKGVKPIVRFTDGLKSREQLYKKLQGWGYVDKLKYKDLSVLFGAGDIVAKNKLDFIREIGIANGEIEQDEL